MNLNRKGLSPLIASVLLVAFTMAVGAIIINWITGFTQQQTTGYSVLTIDNSEVNVVGSVINVTVTYAGGTEILNITGFSVRDANGVTYTNATILTNLAANETRNWAVGTQNKFVNYILTGTVPAGVAWSELRVTGLCQSQYAVTGVTRPS
ncbi:MAG: hypothetical protein HYT71_01615 [Candidatus Aenigmarchaeota archaeon]|nr:hypothetical protein [Candidatus Aenigmarchaeota archaeon]